MLAGFFRVDPADRPKVLLLFLYLLLAVGGSVVIGRSAGRALFLSALPPEAVPLKLAVSAVAVVGATVVYAALGARLPLGRLVVSSQLAMAGGIVVLWVLLRTPIGGTLGLMTGLFGWVEIVAALITTQFWVLAGQLFDPRSARRSFGLIAAGGPLANVGAGALLAGVAERVATADLLLVTAAATGLCALTTVGLARAYPEALEGGGRAAAAARPATGGAGRGTGAGEAAGSSLGSALAAVGRSPLLAGIAGIILLGTAVTNVVDYQLDLALQARYGGDGRAMAWFLGAYNFWVGAAAFVVQVGLIALVLERFGLRAALATLPIGFALGAAAVVASGGALVAVAAARANDLLFRFTLNDAGLNMLYLPVPAAARRRAKEALDGVVKPLVAVVLAGLFALARAAGWNDLVLWSLPTLLLVAAWLWLVGRAGTAYRLALVETLRRRRLSFDGLRIEATDPATRAALLGALHGADDALALAALQTIAEAPGRAWDGAIARLLDSPSPELRVAAAQHLAGSGQAAFASAVGRLLDAPEPAVRAAGAAALAELGDAGEQLERALGDPAVEVRRAAVVGLARGGSNGRAEEVLRGMVASAEPAERAAGAEAIGQIGRAGWEDELAELIEDPAVEVQRAAVVAVAAVGAVGLAERVLERLGLPATAGVAAEALVALAQGVGDAAARRGTGGSAPAPLGLSRGEVYAEGTSRRRLGGALPERGETEREGASGRRLGAAPPGRGEICDEAASPDGGDGVVALLARRLADERGDPAVRRAVPRVLARIGGDGVREALLARVGDGDAGVRGAVYAALAEMGAPDAAAREVLGERVSAELRDGYGLRALLVDLGDEGRGELLGEALEARLDGAIGRVFTLLGILFPSAGLADAWRGVHSAEARQRANALELVDSTLGRGWRVDLMPLLEAPPEQVAELARERFGVPRRSAAERLAELAAGDDRWLRVCALERIGRLGLTDLRGAVESAIVAADELVLETGLVAGQALLAPERVATLLGEARTH